MLRKQQRSSGDGTWVLEILIGPALAARVLLFFLLASQKPDTRAEEPRVRTGASVELGRRSTETTRELGTECVKHATISAGLGSP